MPRGCTQPVNVGNHYIDITDNTFPLGKISFLYNMVTLVVDATHGVYKMVKKEYIYFS